jgi:hypothetical protein
LTPKHNQTLALAAFKMKNNAITKNAFVNGKSPKKEKVLFVTIAGQGKY